MSDDSMRKVLFFALLPIFLLTAVLTMASVFFDVGNLSPTLKMTLVTALILEVAAVVLGLSRRLFGLAPAAQSARPEIPTNSVEGVERVMDSPLGRPIDLTGAVHKGDTDMMDMFIAMITRFASLPGSRIFAPHSCAFVTRDNPEVTYNVNFTVEDLGSGNGEVKPQSLVEYVESQYAEIEQALSQDGNRLIGKREIRSNVNDAVQWYMVEIHSDGPDGGPTSTVVTQVQRYSCVGNLVGITTVTYTSKTEPDQIALLQEVLR